jgi:hypothetical protein
MKNNGFTLLELIVSIVIFIVIISLITSAVKVVGDDIATEDAMQYDPVVESAEAQKKIASEMERQNDLMERQLKIQEANQTPERQ